MTITAPALPSGRAQPVGRAAQWVKPLDAITTDRHGVAIVTGTATHSTSAGRHVPVWRRRRILTWVIVGDDGQITAVGVSVRSPGQDDSAELDGQITALGRLNALRAEIIQAQAREERAA